MRSFWRRAAVLAVAVGLLAAAPRWAEAPASFRVVVHASHAGTKIDRGELSRIFLKQNPRWLDGRTIVVFDQSARSEIRAQFSLAVHKQPVAWVENYWRKQIFSGRGVPPVVKSSDADVLSAVQATPAGIGYVSVSATLPQQVKALEIAD
jgi:ABC-type phosphate transport system substrate-binding protein